MVVGGGSHRREADAVAPLLDERGMVGSVVVGQQAVLLPSTLNLMMMKVGEEEGLWVWLLVSWLAARAYRLCVPVCYVYGWCVCACSSCVV